MGLEWTIKGKLPDAVMDEVDAMLDRIADYQETGVEKFEDLQDWQTAAVKKVLNPVDENGNLPPFFDPRRGFTTMYSPEEHSLSGDYEALAAVGPLVGAAMRAHELEKPVVFDVLSEDADEGEVIAIGPKNWWGMRTQDIAEDPIGSMVELIDKVSGPAVAREMLDKASEALAEKHTDGPSPS